MGDTAKNCRRLIRRRTNILRKVIDHLRNTMLWNKTAHTLSHRFSHVNCQDIRQTSWLKHGAPIKHVAQPTDGFPKEESLRNTIKPFRILQEFLITTSAVGAKLPQIFLHGFFITHKIKNRTIIKKGAPLRLQLNHGNIIFHLSTSFGKDPGKHRGNSKDGRAHVEAVTIFLKNCSLPTQPIILFKQLYLVTPGCQCACGS